MRKKDDTVDHSLVERRRLTPRSEYSKVLDRVFCSILAENGELESQRTEASALCSELLALVPAQRILKIRNSQRYQMWPLAEELLKRCRMRWREDATDAEDLAALALEVTYQLPVTGFRQALLNDLRAEAWSCVANCRRIRSDLAGAQEAFLAGEGFLMIGSGDPVERARFLDLKSSLLRAQRHFQAAAEALAEAIEIYRVSADRHAEGRALIKQAKLVADNGRSDVAIELLQRAKSLVRPEREPRLTFVIRLNLCWHLVDVQRIEAAQSLLPEVRELARQFATRQEHLHVLWLEGAIRFQLEQVELAEEVWTQVRQGFIAAGIGYDVALVSLDLAVLYLEMGRTEDVRRLATETIPVFASLNVQRELLMAWQLFQEAAERDVATLRLVNDVAARIRESQGASAPDSPA